MKINEPDFPVLDAPRTDPGRVVVNDYGWLEPHIEETDDWCSMPLRLTITQGHGPCIEIGPYTLDGGDIVFLRKAIVEYARINESARTLES